MRDARRAHGLDGNAWGDLYRWSIDQPEAFWRAVWEFCGVRGDPGGRAIADPHLMPGARFFPDGRLDFAANLLGRGAEDADALVFQGEEGVRRRMSWHELAAEVARLARALAA